MAKRALSYLKCTNHGHIKDMFYSGVYVLRGTVGTETFRTISKPEGTVLHCCRVNNFKSCKSSIDLGWVLCKTQISIVKYAPF